jgi:hypothetical protein
MDGLQRYTDLNVLRTADHRKVQFSLETKLGDSVLLAFSDGLNTIEVPPS